VLAERARSLVCALSSAWPTDRGESETILTGDISGSGGTFSMGDAVARSNGCAESPSDCGGWFIFNRSAYNLRLKIVFEVLKDQSLMN